MSKKFFEAKTKSDLDRCYPVMKELRPHLSIEDYHSIYEQAHASDLYKVIGVEENGKVVAVMGYRFLSDFVRGRHLYIDDLVASQNYRSLGLGAELLKYAEELCKKEGCQTLRLCTGIENSLGIQFYERNGWRKRSFAYTKQIDLNN